VRNKKRQYGYMPKDSCKMNQNSKYLVLKMQKRAKDMRASHGDSLQRGWVDSGQSDSRLRESNQTESKIAV